MRPTVELVALALLLSLVSGCSPTPTPTPPPGPAPIAPSTGILVVNMIPASLSGETNQDSEPFLAVHSTNAQLMAASAFTPNPGGTTNGLAPIFVSQDGGRTWTLNNIVPAAA